MAHATSDLASSIREHQDTCGAVVLAAGAARRFGAPKMLMPFGQSTVLGTVVVAIASAGVRPIIVVAGTNAPAIESALRDDAVQVICNSDPTRGMVSSIRAGVAALPDSVTRFLIALGDQPRIRFEGISHLLQEHTKSGKGIGLPTYQGRRGHPVVFDCRYRQAVLGLTDEQTLRDLIRAHRDDCVEVNCGSDAYVRDIDTQEQYENEFRRACGEQ